MANNPPSLPRIAAFFGLIALFSSHHCHAFIPPIRTKTVRATSRSNALIPSTTTTTTRSRSRSHNHQSPIVIYTTANTEESSSTTTTTTTNHAPPTRSSLDKLEIVKLALKRPRGASIGVEYVAPSSSSSDDDDDDDNDDLTILSMQLRKQSKCAAIWTSDANSIGKFWKEQEGARGDFPGPVPVIYTGPMTDEGDVDADVDRIKGATAVVLEYNGRDDLDMESLSEFGIIWKVNSVEDLRELIDMEESAGGVFLLSKNMLPKSTDEEDASIIELREVLSTRPKSTVTIAPLATMQNENGEIKLGKHYASSLKISSLLLENACVGDDEDVPYSQYAIEEIGKKSSSSFSMTGLTGSTNGHFGVSSHGGEAKWRRNENK